MDQCIVVFINISFCFLSAKPLLFLLSHNVTRWRMICFNIAILVNFLVAFFYPFDNKTQGKTLLLKNVSKLILIIVIQFLITWEFVSLNCILLYISL